MVVVLSGGNGQGERAQLHRLIPGLEPETYEELSRLTPKLLPEGTVLFRPGDEAPGFVLVLDGTIAVSLTGRSGREIELYAVAPGETCVQTTLCLLGQQVYSAEAAARTPLTLLIVPRGQFARLIDTSPGFRNYVFRSFGTRLADVTAVLEQVAFVRIEARLAAELLKRTGRDGVASVTHQDLASAIGSAREVVSRRLEGLARQGLVVLERGAVRIANRAGLEEVAEISTPP